MKMKKGLLKAVGYAAAPKVMFGMNHPRKAAVLRASQWAMGRVMPARKQSSMGMTAAKGLGAAMVMLPIGWWLGRRVMGQSQGEMAG